MTVSNFQVQKKYTCDKELQETSMGMGTICTYKLKERVYEKCISPVNAESGAYMQTACPYKTP